MRVTEQIQDDVARRVLTDFRPRYAPQGRVVWVSEGNAEPMQSSKTWLQGLRVSAAAEEELPNVVVRDSRRRRLWLVDVATLGRHMNAERRERLSRILRRSLATLLFLTAFENRRQMTRFILDAPWGTIAWFADEPAHLVHFDDHPDARLLAPPS
ncbi:MAG TPA: BsuBI/PstI family type II restriction endonuclease [Pirellulales bacterium]|nr:BsuBI/PstI family type II restriction endonuclease [Pirellulales bacterium]